MDAKTMRLQIYFHLLLPAFVLLLVGFRANATATAAEGADDSMIDVIVNLLGDSDKDLRAIGQQKVAEEAKDPAATKRFAEVLPKLKPEAQTGLIAALVKRGDKSARPAVVDALKSKDDSVRLAAIRAMGVFGESGDVPVLIESLSSKIEAEKTAARGSLEQVRAEGVEDKLVQALSASQESRLQIELIQILERRNSKASVPALLKLAVSDKPDVRARAMTGLGQLASTDEIPQMVQALFKAERGAEREAAEKAVMFVCERVKDPEQRADSLLAVWPKLTDDQKTIALTALGRVGGQKALAIVEAAIAGDNAQRRDAGVRALCNWPDASVVPQLLKLAQDSTNANHRLWATRALPRIAVLRDKRTDADRLDLLKKVMSLATRDDERLLVLDRARALRTMDCVHFVMSYLDKPAFTQRACATLVELAHYGELRGPNKAEFEEILNKVIPICTDATVVETAKRYLKGETVDIRKPAAQ
jgi:HEAT repeat protein